MFPLEVCILGGFKKHRMLWKDPATTNSTKEKSAKGFCYFRFRVGRNFSIPGSDCFCLGVS